MNAITGSLFTSRVLEMNADDASQTEKKDNLPNEERAQDQVSSLKVKYLACVTPRCSTESKKSFID